MTTTLVPKLVVAGADRAIEFYQKAFGAEVSGRYTMPDGLVAIATLHVGEATFDVKDEDGTDPAATTIGGSGIILTLNVDDPDAVAAAMQAAGARVVFPIGDMPYGYRQGRLADPFGYQWILSRRIEELTDAEVQERLDAFDA